VTCPTCSKPIDGHDLWQARACLEPIFDAAEALARRACGGATPGALERELRRPSPTWRTPGLR